jgi:hypothetical protein
MAAQWYAIHPIDNRAVDLAGWTILRSTTTYSCAGVPADEAILGWGKEREVVFSDRLAHSDL